jgi:recombination associated protein RdgC
MPVLRGSVTFARFKVASPARAPREKLSFFQKALETHAFEPIRQKGDEDRAEGFVEVEDNDATDFSANALFHGPRVLFSWRIDQLKISAGRARDELTRWALAFERENGRKPGRAERSEQKAAIRHQLRARATPTTRVHDVAWNLDTGQLQVWSGSRKAIGEVLAALEEAFGLKLVPLVPGAMAAHEGVSDDALTPTKELSGAGWETGHGKA